MAKQPFGALIIHGFTSSLDCVKGLQPPLAALGLPTRMPVLRSRTTTRTTHGRRWRPSLRCWPSRSKRGTVFVR